MEVAGYALALDMTAREIQSAAKVWVSFHLVFFRINLLSIFPVMCWWTVKIYRKSFVYAVGFITMLLNIDQGLFLLQSINLLLIRAYQLCSVDCSTIKCLFAGMKCLIIAVYFVLYFSLQVFRGRLQRGRTPSHQLVLL